MGARSRSSEVILVSCGSSANQLVFSDTVEKFKDVKLKHFYRSLLCPPVITESQDHRVTVGRDLQDH